MMAASQREQALKFEIEVHDRRARSRPRSPPSTTTRPTSPRPSGSSSPTAASPTPPASGFGLERIAMALFRAHGLDPDGWPSEVREELWPAMSTATTGMVSLFGLDPATYVPHALHTPGERTYTETNCYSDILIELVHARGDEPLAVMGFTVRMDFEGDQWTFFKPPPEDLEELFGDRHPRDAAVPPAAAADRRADRRRADDHRRARLLVPARHGLDQLPQRARQDLGDRRGDRSRGASACATSTTRACTSSTARTTAASSGSGAAVLRRRPPPLHRARPLRRRRPAAGRRSCARRRRELLARAPRSGARRRTRSSASATSSPHDLPDAARGRRRRLPRLRLRHRAHVRLGVRDHRLARRLAARRRGRDGLGGAGTDRRRARRCSRCGSPGAGSSTRSRSSRRWPRRGRRR